MGKCLSLISLPRCSHCYQFFLYPSKDTIYIIYRYVVYGFICACVYMCICMCSVSLFPNRLCIPWSSPIWLPLRSSWGPNSLAFLQSLSSLSSLNNYFMLQIICWIGKIFTWVKSHLVWKGKWSTVSCLSLSSSGQVHHPSLCWDFFFTLSF